MLRRTLSRLSRRSRLFAGDDRLCASAPSSLHSPVLLQAGSGVGGEGRSSCDAPTVAARAKADARSTAARHCAAPFPHPRPLSLPEVGRARGAIVALLAFAFALSGDALAADVPPELRLAQAVQTYNLTLP